VGDLLTGYILFPLWASGPVGIDPDRAGSHADGNEVPARQRPGTLLMAAGSWSHTHGHLGRAFAAGITILRAGDRWRAEVARCAGSTSHHRSAAKARVALAFWVNPTTSVAISDRTPVELPAFTSSCCRTGPPLKRPRALCESALARCRQMDEESVVGLLVSARADAPRDWTSAPDVHDDTRGALTRI